MRLIKNTTEFIRIKDPNIIISLVFENGYSYRGSSKTGLSCIRNYFLKYPLKVRQQVQFITMDMSGSYIPLARKLFPNTKIVPDRISHYPAPLTCLFKDKNCHYEPV